jgi:hypothetical protein
VELFFSLLQIAENAWLGLWPYLMKAADVMKKQVNSGLAEHSMMRDMSQLLCSMLSQDDEKRFSCEDALNHRFFSGMPYFLIFPGTLHTIAGTIKLLNALVKRSLGPFCH